MEELCKSEGAPVLADSNKVRLANRPLFLRTIPEGRHSAVPLRHMTSLAECHEGYVSRKSFRRIWKTCASRKRGAVLAHSNKAAIEFLFALRALRKRSGQKMDTLAVVH
jgi:hypothetical protein